MRKLPYAINDRVSKRYQTSDNNAAPKAIINIKRPTSPLVNKKFLEQQTINAKTVDDVSIAVSHRYKGSNADEIKVGYVYQGVAKVIKSDFSHRMDGHNWIYDGFYEYGDSIAVAYDGTMPKYKDGTIEFITEEQPWVFWTNDGTLYARKHKTKDKYILAEGNCTDVTAVRGMWSEVGNFDDGLIVFFVMAQQIYYRQLINGTWTDATLMNFGPSTTWLRVTANRTWDYRIVLQAKSTYGTVFEFYTQFAGFGKQNVEHISISDVKATSRFQAKRRVSYGMGENISISDVSLSVTKLWANTSVPVKVYNTNGTVIYCVFDHPIKSAGDAIDFTIRDKAGEGVTWSAIFSSLSEDHLTIKLTFNSFLHAEGDLELNYGGLNIMCDTVKLEPFSKIFTPTGLIVPVVDPPTPKEIWNE